MAISRFQSRFKTRTDLMDNITPNNVVQMNASVPHGEWKPASWLPVVWQNEKSKDYFTISSGKVVSLDGAGRVVPSGLRKVVANAAIDGTVLTYTSDDVKARVIDITTGQFVTAAKTVDLEAFVHAIIGHGWLHTDELIDDADAATKLAANRAAAKAFISAPVGIAAYDVYVWAGDDPANLHFTNYQKQHLIQFFTDIQMRVAHICDEAEAVDLTSLVRISGATLGTAASYPRYVGLDMSNVVGYSLGLGKVANNTSRTPVTFSDAAFSATLRERSDISLLAKVGDWYLDADAGIILFWEEGGNQDPAGLAGNILVSDYTVSNSNQERMMMMVGDCVPGDFVSFDVNSNFTVAETADFDENLVVGRMLALFKEPRGLLERVKTGFSGSDFDATAQMPGSATKGHSDLITLSHLYGSDDGDLVADEIAVINVKIQ
jgi:hypothetical protein